MADWCCYLVEFERFILVSGCSVYYHSFPPASSFKGGTAACIIGQGVEHIAALMSFPLESLGGMVRWAGAAVMKKS